jgi:hypothetical protein
MQKELEILEYFNYMGSQISSDTRCAREIKSRTAVVKAQFRKKKNLFIA